MSIPLAALEDIIDASGIALAIEDLLPRAARGRQLTARTLLLGMILTVADGRPAHLTRVRQALTSLPGADQERLGVTVTWKTGPHQLTYRQTEHTARLITRAPGKQQPDGAPSEDLQSACDQLLEASIPPARKNASTALAGDWTDVETWSRPPRHGSTQCADPEASWGHRNSNLPGPKGEMFFGYYLSAAVMTREENGPPVPELARRMTVARCAQDPVRAMVPVLEKMPAGGIPLGDIIADSGYAHRDAEAWAVPLRRAGAQLVQDLHPHDRGPRGTHEGAIIANGNLYCPATPKPLLKLGPLPPGAPAGDTAAHDQQTAELARHKLGRHTTDDADGYHRVTCPATAGKIRCPLRPESMKLDRSRPRDPGPARPPASLLHPADHHRPARGRTPRPGRNTTTPQRPGGTPTRGAPAPNAAFSTIKDTATTSIARGWCRLTRPDPAHAVARLRPRRPQPAHPARIRRPAGRQRPPRRRWPPTGPQQTPHHARGPARGAAITRQQDPRRRVRQPHTPHASPRTHAATTAHSDRSDRARQPGAKITSALTQECQCQM